LLLAQLAEYTFFLRGMFDTLGNVAIGCEVAIWEGRTALYWTASQFGKTEEKPALYKEKTPKLYYSLMRTWA